MKMEHKFYGQFRRAVKGESDEFGCILQNGFGTAYITICTRPKVALLCYKPDTGNSAFFNELLE